MDRKELFGVCIAGSASASSITDGLNKGFLDTPFRINKNTPLLVSILNNNREVFFKLIDLDCSLFSLNNKGLSPLEALAWKNGFWWIEDNLELIEWQMDNLTISKEEKGETLNGLLKACIAHQKPSLIDWCLGKGAIVTKIKEGIFYEKFGKDESVWKDFIEDYNMQSYLFSSSNIPSLTTNHPFATSDNPYDRIPTEVYLYRAPAFIKEKFANSNIHLSENQKIYFCTRLASALERNSKTIIPLFPKTVNPVFNKHFLTYLFNLSLLNHMNISKSLIQFGKSHLDCDIVNFKWKRKISFVSDTLSHLNVKNLDSYFNIAHTLIQLSNKGDNSSNHSSNTTLIIRKNREEAVKKFKFLLDNGLDPNLRQNKSNYYLLHMIAKKGSEELMQLILNYDVYLCDDKNFKGKTPLKIAGDAGRENIYAILEEQILKKNLSSTLNNKSSNFKM